MPDDEPDGEWVSRDERRAFQVSLVVFTALVIVATVVTTLFVLQILRS